MFANTHACTYTGALLQRLCSRRSHTNVCYVLMCVGVQCSYKAVTTIVLSLHRPCSKKIRASSRMIQRCQSRPAVHPLPRPRPPPAAAARQSSTSSNIQGAAAMRSTRAAGNYWTSISSRMTVSILGPAETAKAAKRLRLSVRRPPPTRT